MSKRELSITLGKASPFFINLTNSGNFQIKNKDPLHHISSPFLHDCPLIMHWKRLQTFIAILKVVVEIIVYQIDMRIL